MSPRSITFLLTFLIAAPGAGAFDDQADPEDSVAIVTHIFEVSDLDADGSLSSDEYSAAGLDAFGLGFEACDGDANGELTSEEFLDLYRQHHRSAPELEV